MLHKIMVPLDGSPFAEAALPTAFHLARRDAAEVQLVMVWEPPPPITRAGCAPVRDPEFDRERRREAGRYLEALLDRIDAADRARAGTGLLEGWIAETLAARARGTAVDLVVMIEHAIDMAGIEGVEYTLLRVLAASESPTRAALPRRGEAPSSRTRRATVEALLDSTADELRARGLAVTTHIVVNDNAPRGILDYAAERGAGLIA